jgi:hypothetical protein
MLQVLRTFTDGKKTYRRGALIDAKDPVVKGRGHLFMDVGTGQPVEQATASPGERRNLFLEQKAAVAKAKEKEAKKAAKKTDKSNAEASNSEPAAEPTKGVGFVCDVCGKQAKNQSGLLAHQRAKHVS